MPRANSKMWKKDTGWLTWEEVRKKNVKIHDKIRKWCRPRTLLPRVDDCQASKTSSHGRKGRIVSCRVWSDDSIVRNAPVLIAFGDPWVILISMRLGVLIAHPIIWTFTIYSASDYYRRSRRWKKVGDTMRKEIHFVVPEDNSIVWEKSGILNRVVWTEHKILPVRV